MCRLSVRKAKEPAWSVGAGMQQEACPPEQGSGGGQHRVCSHGAHFVKDQKAVGVESRASCDLVCVCVCVCLKDHAACIIDNRL